LITVIAMKVLHLSASDINGGAARAAYRLHQGLRQVGVDSQMLVGEKASDDLTIAGPQISLLQGIARSKITLDVLPLKFLYKQWNRAHPFSLQWLPERVAAQVEQMQPEVIDLHWVGSGFVQIKTLARFQVPLVMTLHDMWALTGGCHYSGDCHRYTANCGRCPLLESDRETDITRRQWTAKQRHWQSLNLTLVAPSQWLATCARSSSLFHNHAIECIPNGIDTRLYQPFDRPLARQLLNLPADKQLILFGAIRAASEPRKGFPLLQTALQHLKKASWDNFELVILGASPPAIPLDLGFKVHYLGTLKDDLSLALAYAAADVFILPSLQDNLPNVVLEAIACGLPCVGFKIGGIPDMIEHQRNGYLAQPFDTEDLAQGIAWVLADRERQEKLSHRAREKAEQEYTLERQASRYQKLYSQVVARQHSP
jgi:glycosyltransferase involved in cell wall biosynthesis